MSARTPQSPHGGASPLVKRKAKERLKEELADIVDPTRALREASRLAYSDIRELFDAYGNILPMSQWPDGAAAAVAGVEVVIKNAWAGDNQTDTVYKLKLWDKSKNLELLFRHLGLLEDLTVSQRPIQQLIVQVVDGSGRALPPDAPLVIDAAPDPERKPLK